MAEAAPTDAIIGAVFDGVEQAVDQVAGLVAETTDRLARDPCAWANQLASTYSQIDQRYASATQLALSLRTAGIAAINSAIADAGFATPGHVYNAGSIVSFGVWLDQRGYTTSTPIPGLLGLPILIPPWHFVRRGAPRRAAGGLSLGGGVYLYPETPNGRLAGPTIAREWDEWVAYVRGQVQPIGRLYGPRGGWRGVVAALTGSPTWRPGESWSPASRLGILESRRALVLNMRAVAAERCRERDPAPRGSAGGLLLLVAGALLLRRRK